MIQFIEITEGRTSKKLISISNVLSIRSIPGNADKTEIVMIGENDIYEVNKPYDYFVSNLSVLKTE